MRWLVIAFVFVGYSSLLFAQQDKVTVPNDSVLTVLMKQHRIPALGIGAIEQGKIKETKVLGELKAGVPAPANTLFQVASLTKPIVEMTVLRLVSKQLWSLDEPLHHYWIDPDVKDDARNKLLTTRHVLSHQTGFMNWRWLHATGKLTFDFAPGTKTQYSGEGLEYLKKALEAKFKMPLADIVEKYLFLPDGMKDTHFYWDGGVDETRYAVAHNREGNEYDIRKNEEASAADLLMTTITDYSALAMNVLNKKGLSQNVWDDMIRLQGKDNQAKFGLGWEVYSDLSHGEYALIHSGSDPGVRTIAILLPISQRALIIFTNSDNGMSIIKDLIGTSLDVGGELIKRAK